MRSYVPKRFVLLVFVWAHVALIVAACAAPRTVPSMLGPDRESGGDSEDEVSAPGPDLGAAQAEAGAITPVSSDDGGPAEAEGDDGTTLDEPYPEEGDADAMLPDGPAPPFDAGDGGVCPGPPGPGDLVIDELMIASVAGSGDHGEWLEVTSTLACALDLRGLRGNAPSGSRVQTFDIGDDLWIPAFGTFLVADSSIAAINHEVPGALVVWSGQPGDVLRNQGATVTLQSGDVIVDTVTYPSMTLVDGVSLAFPPDCAPAMRADWTKWQPSTASWFPGFHGTPNAPNDDVRCP
jgi:hypothetical protein